MSYKPSFMVSRPKLLEPSTCPFFKKKKFNGRKKKITVFRIQLK